MLIKKYYNIIFEDLWKDFEYKIKEWWDYYVFIIDNSIVYRFPKKEKNINELEKEKKILDILKENISINIPNIKIVWWIWYKYKIIPWNIIKKISLIYLNKDDLNNILDDIVLFLKELHSIPINKFDFLKSEEADYNIYKDYLKNEIDIRLRWKVEYTYIKKLKLYIDDLFALNFKEKALVHTDIQAKNIIFDYQKNKISWIIDFSDCRLSWRENDFVHFLDWWEEIFENIIVKYLWFYDEDFVKTIKFLYKKTTIFEIMNDEIYKNNFNYLLEKIKNF